jgi:hypothetical protein
MKTEIKGNLVFAVLYVLCALAALFGVCAGAEWQIWVFLLSVGLSYVMLTARADDGTSAWGYLKKFIK